MNIYKYNFKNFFDESKTEGLPKHNNTYLTNRYFMINKSYLKKNELEYINKFDEDATLTSFFNNMNSYVENCNTVFEPEFIILDHSNDGNKINILYCIYDDKKFAIQESFYNFFKSKGLNICFDSNSTGIKAMAAKDNDNNIIGISMPINPKTVTAQGINYNDYITQQEQQNEQSKIAKKERQVNTIKAKVCLWDGVKNKTLEFYKELNGLKFYTLPNKKEFNDNAYVDITGYMYPICQITNVESVSEKIKADNIDLKQWLYDGFISNLNSEFKPVDPSVAEMFGMVEQAKEHNKKIREYHEQRREKEEQEHQEKENQYITERNEKFNNIITEAEQNILNKKAVKSETITHYTGMYNSKDYDLILYLFKKYNINVPLKTQGWIKEALYKIFWNENRECWSYEYLTSSANSTVFSNYLQELINKITGGQN